MSLDAGRLATAADANFRVHAAFAAERTSGMRVVAVPGLTLVDSGQPCDTLNLVLGARLAESDADAAIRRVIGHFSQARRPFSWWVGPSDEPADLPARLSAAGLEASESELAMAADLSRTHGALPPPEELRIERASTPGQLREFAEVNAANWSPPDPEVLRFYERAAPVLLSEVSPLRFYLGRAGGVAAAAVELAIAGGVAGIYNVATREAFRRRGFGHAMTNHVLREARAMGIPTAILQAAPDGVGIYRRAGFEEFGRIVEYKPPTAASRSSA